jgi:hypothetical protein
MFKIDSVDEYNNLQAPIVIAQAIWLVVVVRGSIIHANEMVIDDVDEDGEDIHDILEEYTSFDNEN